MIQEKSGTLSSSHWDLSDENSCKEEIKAKRCWAPYCEMLKFCCAPVLTSSRSSWGLTSANRLLQPSLRSGGGQPAGEGEPAVGGDPATWGWGGCGGVDDPSPVQSSDCWISCISCFSFLIFRSLSFKATKQTVALTAIKWHGSRSYYRPSIIWHGYKKAANIP